MQHHSLRIARPPGSAALLRGTLPHAALTAQPAPGAAPSGAARATPTTAPTPQSQWRPRSQCPARPALPPPPRPPGAVRSRRCGGVRQEGRWARALGWGSSPQRPAWLAGRYAAAACTVACSHTCPSNVQQPAPAPGPHTHLTHPPTHPLHIHTQPTVPSPELPELVHIQHSIVVGVKPRKHCGNLRGLEHKAGCAGAQVGGHAPYPRSGSRSGSYSARSRRSEAWNQSALRPAPPGHAGPN